MNTSPIASPTVRANKSLVVFLASMQLILFIIYGAFVNPVNSTVLGSFQWLTMLTIVASLGFLYLNNYQRQFMGNIVGNWLIMWLISFEVYFLFVYLWTAAQVGKSITPLFGSSAISASNLPLLMLTVAYVNLKGFLKFPQVIILTIVGIIGFSCNQMVIGLSLEGYDIGSMTIFLFGTIYGMVVRLIGVPPRNHSQLNKHIEMTKTHSMFALLFALIYFPVLASQTDIISSLATANTFLCMACSLIASIIIHVGTNRKIHFQTLYYCAVASALIIMVTPGLIQNAAAPAIIGTIVGFTYSFLREFMLKVMATLKVPDPALIIALFGIPAFVGGILSAIFIACYNMTEYNKLADFPYTIYAKILIHPLKTGAMQIAVLVVNCLMALATGLVTGFIIKYSSQMNELEEDSLLWSEKETGANVTGESNQPLLSNEVEEPVRPIYTQKTSDALAYPSMAERVEAPSRPYEYAQYNRPQNIYQGPKQGGLLVHPTNEP